MGQAYSYSNYQEQKKQLEQLRADRKELRKSNKNKKYAAFAKSEDHDAEKHEEEEAVDFLEQIKTKLKQKSLTDDEKIGLKTMLKTQKQIVDILHHRVDRRNKYKYRIVPRTLRNWWYKRHYGVNSSPDLTKKMNEDVKNLRNTQRKQYKNASGKNYTDSPNNHDDTPTSPTTKTSTSPPTKTPSPKAKVPSPPKAPPKAPSPPKAPLKAKAPSPSPSPSPPVNGLITRSANFFDTYHRANPHIENLPDENKVHYLLDQRIIGFDKAFVKECMDGTHPFIHHKTIALIQNFIQLYPDRYPANMSANAFVNRCLTKRPLAFYYITDITVLRPGTPQGTFIDYDPEYINYDEMQISALMSMYVPTYFLNEGLRNNGIMHKILQNDNNAKTSYGVFVASVGARFEKPGFMEYAHILVTRKQNTANNGYGKNPGKTTKSDLLKIWAQFYGISHFPEYDEINDSMTQYIK